ncbi:MAG TPA: hypothetical protein VMI10_10445 [Terriglobales bacterium]|nr:hypothetical protein [Terriglobales bacterium]HTT21698.1 hypothetical protein [Candidatus Sulfotelmatobacter sp.]
MQRDISSFSGEVVDTDHLEEVSGLTVSGSGSTWTDVHREIWVRPWNGVERRFTFTNANVPARKGHRVALLLGGGRPLALINFSTEQYVNLVTPRQFELFGALEAFAFAGMLIAAGLTGSAGLIALLVGTVAYASTKWLIRQHRYTEAWSSVEAEIRSTIAHPPAVLANEGFQRGAS